MKKWLFNPFIYIAGLRALLIGIGVMLLTAFIGYYSKSHFDGVLDTHTGRFASLPVYFLEQLIDWGCVVLLFYSAGTIFSRSKIRFIDIAGTLALARWPMIICAVIGFGVKMPPHSMNVDDIVKAISAATIALGILELLCTIWMIALTYNAFTVSCNIKGSKAIGVFIFTLLAAEILSHILLHQVYNHFI